MSDISKYKDPELRRALLRIVSADWLADNYGPIVEAVEACDEDDRNYAELVFLADSYVAEIMRRATSTVPL